MKKYLGLPFEFHEALQTLRAERHASRVRKLHTALDAHKLRSGDVVIVRGRKETYHATIVKVNVTRIKVRREDGSMWTVPGNCIAGKANIRVQQ